MSKTKHFIRSVRQEISRISVSLKQMEFQVLKTPGFLKRKLRKQIRELKRMKDAIIRRLAKLSAEAQLHLPTMQVIREEIQQLHERCRQLKAQHG